MLNPLGVRLFGAEVAQSLSANIFPGVTLESQFGIPLPEKDESIKDKRKKSGLAKRRRVEAGVAVFERVEIIYHREQFHSTPGDKSIVDFSADLN
jgi:hypothetical protein